ncbi:MAG TPA: biopolymer transporter ExbD [Blastocatellia bacterium]|nr:biopolymer transporter ExbD [Blastocatellia bacterium]
MAHGTPDESEGTPARKLGMAPPNINVTPLIDVLLVLLIIFMVIQPQKEAKFESQIPQKPRNEDTPAAPNETLLVVEVKREGNGPEQQVLLNKSPMQLIELQNALKAVLDQRLASNPEADKTVFIKAPKDKRYGDIVAVIDAVKGAGAAPIGLQIDFLE